ncbi:hypothetical protein [Polyangium fumosum]|uniref:Lipoprotein n=1 Tax=Polyangium fumosum TaxID=889272 RepID=A0A4V5PN00_9BACT|nr:hypothetical protein [Polyangium fumosum]TKD08576.1 hypothetical protein E8A74_14915 [Polyangium fumosum]
MNTRAFAIALLIPATLATTSCRKQEEMTTAEALQAVQEASISGDAENVTSGSIEITTDFTIGQAAEAAAQEIRDFVTSQLPCAAVTLAGAKLTVEYGKNPGSCTYKGNTYSGTHEITVTKNEMSDVVVNHTWSKLSNGRVEVSGTAEVTWSASDKTRHVAHELDWTRLSDGKTGKGTGDRTQRPLEGGLAEGFQVDGARSWTGQGGTWDLAIEGVQFRWVDPVPQAGTYRLADPKERSIEMSFGRVDEDTIEVTLKSGAKSFSFNVSKAGTVSES